MGLEVIGPCAAGVPLDARNLVWQAAEMAGWTGHIILEKNLPHGAGLGGGSADAAAVLRHLDTPQFAPELGADVAVCLSSRFQRMQGIGDVLSRVDAPEPLWAVLVNPNVKVSTPMVFGTLPNKNNPAMATDFPTFRSTREMMFWLADQRNDLENAAIKVAPVIGQVLHEISTLTGVYLSRMSGSGATCFGLFDNQGAADLAVKDLSSAHPDWWVSDCALS